MANHHICNRSDFNLNQGVKDKYDRVVRLYPARRTCLSQRGARSKADYLLKKNKINDPYQLVFSSLLLILSLNLSILTLSHALNKEEHESRARIDTALYSSFSYIPLALTGGSTITLVSERAFSEIAEYLKDDLQIAHKELSQTYGHPEPFYTSLRILSRRAFTEETAAPSWTNAIFLKGEILIPIDSIETIDLEDLSRAARHEYSHSFLNNLTKGRCPGWLDEGLAQLFEGEESQLSKHAIKNWFSSRIVVPFSMLKGGFTKLDHKLVPNAYAQSFFSAKYIRDTFSTETLKNYFNSLHNGEDSESAFRDHFGFSTNQLERSLHSLINKKKL
jgi:hypothetical protein